MAEVEAAPVAQMEQALLDWDSTTVSAVVAAHAIDAIVEKGAEQLYEKYLQAKEQDFVVQRTVASLQHLIEWQLPVIDGNQFRGGDYNSLPSPSAGGLWTCEPEPQPAPLDSWARSAVPSKLPLMRRKEILQARRAASLHAQQRQAEELAAAQAEQAAQQQVADQARGARPSSMVGSRPGTVGSQLATIAEGRDEGGDGRIHDAGKMPQSLASQRKAVLAAIDRKAKAEADDRAKAERLAKEKAARDKALKKALDGKSYTLDERGGIIVVDGVDPHALPAGLARHVDAGVDHSQDGEAEDNARRRSKSGGQSPVKPGLSGTLSQASLTNDRLARADMAAQLRDDRRYRRETGLSQPSLLDSLGGEGQVGVSASLSSMGSPKQSMSALVSPGVSVRETGRMIVGPSPQEDPRHVTRRQIEAKRTGTGVSSVGSVGHAGQLSEGGGLGPGYTPSRSYMDTADGNRADLFTASTMDNLARDSEWDNNGGRSGVSNAVTPLVSPGLPGHFVPMLTSVKAGTITAGGISLNSTRQHTAATANPSAFPLGTTPGGPASWAGAHGTGSVGPAAGSTGGFAAVRR